MERDKKHDDPQQSVRFIDTARQQEADETKEGADRAFRKIASKDSRKASTKGSS